jgi:hypothetical protein
MYYWAAYYGTDIGMKLVKNFRDDMGISPFVPMRNGLSPVVGAIKGEQLDIFRELVSNTRWNLRIVHLKEGDDPSINIEPRRSNIKNRYFFQKGEDCAMFEKGRQDTDNLGNSILHHIFYINNVETRN